MLNLFKKRNNKKEALRLLEIAKTVDPVKRINNVVDYNFRKLLYAGERTALNGDTSFNFNIEIPKRDVKYYNEIIHEFTSKLCSEGFVYTRNLIKDKNQFTVKKSVQNCKYN